MWGMLSLHGYWYYNVCVYVLDDAQDMAMLHTDLFTTVHGWWCSIEAVKLWSCKD